jgi:hypothetical protein
MLISSSNQMCLEHAKEIFDKPQKDLFNNVLHASIGDHLTLTLRGFVVRNQISNLTLDSSFDHNSCILGLNEQCKGISSYTLQDLSNGIHGAQFDVCLPFQLRF